MSQPRAYLLTWTTYGTWLHGDDRGSVDDVHNVPGGEHAPPNAAREAANFAVMNQPPLRLDFAARRIVQEAIVEHCAFRGWDLLVLNLRSNHVHMVVYCDDTPPKEATKKLKARCTRQLRSLGHVGVDRQVWTECGSGRYLWDEDSVQAAVKYVMDGQGPDLP